MIDLSVKKKKEYGEMYNSFIDKIKKNKEDYNNYNDYIKGIRNAKKYFDKYIENQCTSYANIYIKNSPAYYTRYYHCKFSLYDERVNFYKNYQDQYG
jgi:hypothetical protein